MGIDYQTSVGYGVSLVEDVQEEDIHELLSPGLSVMITGSSWSGTTRLHVVSDCHNITSRSGGAMRLSLDPGHVGDLKEFVRKNRAIVENPEITWLAGLWIF